MAISPALRDRACILGRWTRSSIRRSRNGRPAAHPERFVKGLPEPKPVPAEVWINRPVKEVPQA